MSNAKITLTIYDIDKINLTSEQDVRNKVIEALEKAGLIYEGVNANIAVNYIDFVDDDGQTVDYPVFSDNGVWR